MMRYAKVYNAAIVEGPNPTFKYVFFKDLDLFENMGGLADYNQGRYTLHKISGDPFVEANGTSQCPNVIPFRNGDDNSIGIPLHTVPFVEYFIGKPLGLKIIRVAIFRLGRIQL
jgi:hypothetical protein